jgi:hypothetical protein
MFGIRPKLPLNMLPSELHRLISAATSFFQYKSLRRAEQGLEENYPFKASEPVLQKAKIKPNTFS